LFNAAIPTGEFTALLQDYDNHIPKPSPAYINDGASAQIMPMLPMLPVHIATSTALPAPVALAVMTTPTLPAPVDDQSLPPQGAQEKNLKPTTGAGLEPVGRKSGRARKPSTRKDIANAIGESRFVEKENATSKEAKATKTRKQPPDGSAENIVRCVWLVSTT
jgi:hypothetical protein